MPKISCFCVYECAGTNIKKTDEKQRKTDKIEHENGKVSKAKAGEGIKLKMSRIVLKDHQSCKNNSWNKFEEIVISSPSSFKSCQFWSFKEDFEEISTKALKVLKEVKNGP